MDIKTSTYKTNCKTEKVKITNNNLRDANQNKISNII